MKRSIARLGPLAAGLLLLATPAPAADNFAIAPSEAERLFAGAPFGIVEAERTASGVAGAQKWKLRFPDGRVIKAKWKAAPAYTTDGWNNSPRREIAAYEIQKWFLDEADYVVPPSEVRCVPLEVMEDAPGGASPNMRGVRCVYGVLSLWLQGVEEPDDVWQPELFEEGGYYRFSIAATNVLTYLIGHQDGRPANFLWASDDHHVFSIDNGISFGAFPYNFLVKNWNSIRVPALPRKVVERLEDVEDEEIEDLGIMRELRVDRKGILRPVEHPEDNLDPDRGTRVSRGVVQFGLERSEIRDVKERLGELLRRVESGEIAVF